MLQDILDMLTAVQKKGGGGRQMGSIAGSIDASLRGEK